MLLLYRHFEPLIADTAAAATEDDGGGREKDKEGGGGDGDGNGNGENDKLAIWWRYIQAVQNKLPSDEQVWR